MFVNPPDGWVINGDDNCPTDSNEDQFNYDGDAEGDVCDADDDDDGALDDDDAEDNDWGQFDTMYDTGHKFYGLMDFYLARNGSTTGYYGLEDYAIKFKGTPKPGWTAKMDWHHFRTQSDLSDGDTDTVRNADGNFGGTGADYVGTLSSDLGTEVDLTLVHKYDANTKIALGYSHYWTTELFGYVNCGVAGNGGTCGAVANNDDADWMYVQIDTKF